MDNISAVDAETEGQDEDGLANHYDAVIVGTGIVESLLACAIQLIPGKKVLHLDPLDYYGRDLTTMNLSDLVDLARSGGIKYQPDIEACQSIMTEEDVKTALKQKQSKPDTINFEELFLLNAKEPKDILRVLSHSMGADEPARIVETHHRRTHPACTAYKMEYSTVASFDSSKIHPSFFGYITHRKYTLARAIHDSRRFSLDLSTKLLMAGESMVECMVTSDVGRYLEFKAIEHIYMLKRDDKTNPIWTVSCSKVVTIDYRV